MRPRQQTPFQWGMNQPQRQQMPFQWGIGPQRQQMPSHWGIQPQRSMGPMQLPSSHSMMRMPQQARQGGGLLAKILGRRNAAPSGFLGINPGNMGGAAAKGSILNSLSNPAGISSLLTNTQQVLQAAQQIAPMVQQYGPLVRNIPAMWKLYRGLKDATAESTEDTTEETTEDSPGETDEINSEPYTVHATPISIEHDTEKEKKIPPMFRMNSKPKLYI